MRFRFGVGVVGAICLAFAAVVACGDDDPALGNGQGGDASSNGPDGSTNVPVPPGTTPDAAPEDENAVFATDDRVLGRFELNGNLDDTSGLSRHGKPFDPINGAPTFVPSAFGQALVLPGNQFQGIVWSQHSPAMTKPFTVEMVLIPKSTACWARLFGWDLSTENGWYLCKGFESWPIVPLGPDFPANKRIYLALVVHAYPDGGVEKHPDGGDSDLLDIYVDGVVLGRTLAGFTAPPPGALFFRDNAATGENYEGAVEAIRISIGERRLDEIQAVQARLAARPQDGGK